jgi:hypothetical protein
MEAYRAKKVKLDAEKAEREHRSIVKIQAM